MRFERAGEDDEERPVIETGNRWYFFIPLVMVGVWLLVTAAQALAFALVPHSAGIRSLEAANVLHDVLDVIDWVGGLGWLLLLPFYLVVLANKRASAWWSVGAFCCGANLLLYVVLLFLPARRRHISAVASFESLVINADSRPQTPTLLMRDSFVCEQCAAILNYGVSECHACGQRYQYTDDEKPRDLVT